MDLGRFTTTVLDLGERMLKCGAEIYRVEDTVTRICKAYGAERVDIFAVTSFISLTVHQSPNESFTQSRMIKNYKTNLEYLNNLNDFSRKICTEKPDPEKLGAMLESIPKNTYPQFVKVLGYALCSVAFSCYAGGNVAEAALSALVGILLALCSFLFKDIKINPVFRVFCSALFCGTLASFLHKILPGISVDKVIIGNIMIMVPGLAAANSVRDMINGDVISGLVRMAESVFIAIAIAVGFALAMVLFGL